MRKMSKALAVTLAACLLFSCKSGYNKIYNESDDSDDDNGTPCEPSPADSNANSETKRVLKLIATFSCEKKAEKNRVISGQHLGFASDLDGSYTNNAYRNLLQPFIDKKITPGIISVEYGLDKFSESQQKIANDTLKIHADKNGIVSISWMPSNPWSSTSNTGYTNEVDLHALNTETDSAAVKRWHDQIDRLANGLLDLQTKGVTVLLRPMPAMNSKTYWWGTQASNDKENEFESLWKALYDRLQGKGLDNILWVFSPMDQSVGENKAVNWGFDGKYVDIVAGIARNDALTIRDYSDYVNMDKPLGMSELSPAYNTNSSNGKFDTRQYKSKLTTDYPNIAFWISWTNEVVNGTTVKLSLLDNEYEDDLLKDSAVYTTEKISDEDWLE